MFNNSQIGYIVMVTDRSKQLLLLPNVAKNKYTFISIKLVAIKTLHKCRLKASCVFISNKLIVINNINCN